MYKPRGAKSRTHAREVLEAALHYGVFAALSPRLWQPYDEFEELDVRGYERLWIPRDAWSVYDAVSYVAASNAFPVEWTHKSSLKWGARSCYLLRPSDLAPVYGCDIVGTSLTDYIQIGVGGFNVTES